MSAGSIFSKAGGGAGGALHCTRAHLARIVGASTRLGRPLRHGLGGGFRLHLRRRLLSDRVTKCRLGVVPEALSTGQTFTQFISPTSFLHT